MLEADETKRLLGRAKLGAKLDMNQILHRSRFPATGTFCKVKTAGNQPRLVGCVSRSFHRLRTLPVSPAFAPKPDLA
jgi:hypothetical protein